MKRRNKNNASYGLIDSCTIIGPYRCWCFSDDHLWAVLKHPRGDSRNPPARHPTQYTSATQCEERETKALEHFLNFNHRENLPSHTTPSNILYHSNNPSPIQKPQNATTGLRHRFPPRCLLIKNQKNNPTESRAPFLSWVLIRLYRNSQSVAHSPRVRFGPY